MFSRIIKKPNKSFFLFGPRGTGKSTWLKTHSFDLIIDLLNTTQRLKLQRDPHYLVNLTKPLKKNSWILIDEVQKIPELLDEVQLLYQTHCFHFALSGSSAGKLKRSRGNLLAGRVLNRSLYSFCYPEYKEKIKLNNRIEWGTLPLVIDNFDYKEDTLDTYVDNYLRQELIEEGLIRKLEPFARFLQIAGIMNGQVLNLENISRECMLARSTVEKYFEVLLDTLIAYKIPAYQPGLKIKETSSPKFYFFDSGVARACAGLSREPLEGSYGGYLFETFLINEIKAYNSYFHKNKELFYYNIASSFEIDLIIQLQKRTLSRPEKVIIFEFKQSKAWNPKWNRNLLNFSNSKKTIKVERIIGVYCGEEILQYDQIEILPVDIFLQRLFKEDFF